MLVERVHHELKRKWLDEWGGVTFTKKKTDGAPLMRTVASQGFRVTMMQGCVQSLGSL
jgi:hypothetical protein